MTEYWTDFVQESSDRITELNNALLTLERNPDDPDAMEEVFRIAHTLKGNCGAAGLESASELAHAIEDLLDAVRSGRLEVSPELMDDIFDAVDRLETMIESVDETGSVDTDPSASIQALRDHLEGPAPIEPPSDEELEDVLSRFEPPAGDQNTYFVRISVDESVVEGGNAGILVVKALIDAFDLIGTAPPRESIEANAYNGRFDAVFASAVTEAAIASGLEPVDEVAAFELVDVTELFETVAARPDTDDGTEIGGPDDIDISPDEAKELEVDELLGEFDQYDDLDELVEEVEDDDDLDAFDNMGKAGSFDDLLGGDDVDVEFDEDEIDEPAADADAATGRDTDGAVETANADTGTETTEPEPSTSTATADAGSTDAGSSASTSSEPADDEPVDDAEAVFQELKDEVEMVGFDELQEELEELEFDEFDTDDEVGMDELLGDDIDDDGDDPFLGGNSSTEDGDDLDEELDELDAVDEASDDELEAALLPDESDDESAAEVDDESESADDADDGSAVVDETTDEPEPDSEPEPVAETDDAVDESDADPESIDDSADPVTDEVVADALEGDGESEDAPATESDADTASASVDDVDDAIESAAATEAEAESDSVAADEDAVEIDDDVAVDADADVDADATPDSDEDDFSTETGGFEPATDNLEASDGASESAASQSDADSGEPSEPAHTDEIVDFSQFGSEIGASDAESGSTDTDATGADDSEFPSDDNGAANTPALESVSVAADDDEAVDGDGDVVADDGAEFDADADEDTDAPEPESDSVAVEGEGEAEAETEADDSDVTTTDDGRDLESAASDSPSDASDATAEVDSDVDDESVDDGSFDDDTDDESFADESFDDESFADDTVDDAFADESFDDESFADDSFDDDLEAETDFDDSLGFDETDDTFDEPDDAFSDPDSDFDDLEVDAGADFETEPSDSFDEAAASADDGFGTTPETTDTDDGFGAETDDSTDETPDRIVDEPNLEIPDITLPDDEISRDAEDETDEMQSVRVDVEQIDDLLTLVEGLVTSRVRLRHAVESDEDRQALETELDALEDLTTELQDTVMEVRLVPLQTVTNRLPRVVRDISREQGKEVAFEMHGEDVELDRTILDRISDPLIHLVRNAVDHGIEPPEQREEGDKPREGTVEVTATRSRDRVTITVDDDGSGIDPDRLRSEAVEEGIISEDEAEGLADDQVYDLVFHPGLSTAEEVTDVSGRGVGMDVVKRTVTELDGSVSIDSTPGDGTTITMTLPVSIAIDDVLFVESGDREFGLPTEVVHDVESAHVIEMVDGEPVVPTDDDSDDIPVVRLGDELETSAAGTSGETDGVVVRIREDVRRVALQCDQVNGQQEVVVKPFDGFMNGIPGLSGATVRGRGKVVNILDVTTL